MAVLIKVFHRATAEVAQTLVDKLTARKIPLVWDEVHVKRVLDHKINKKDQVLFLLMSCNGKAKAETRRSWVEYANKSNFQRMLEGIQKQRLLEYNKDVSTVVILPPGAEKASDIIRKRSGS